MIEFLRCAERRMDERRSGFLTREKAMDFCAGGVEVLNLHEAQMVVNSRDSELGAPVNFEASRRSGLTVFGNAIFLTGESKWK